MALACSGTVLNDGGGGARPGQPGMPGAPGSTGGGNSPGGGAPGSSGSPGAPSNCQGAPALPSPRVWRLTHRQYRNTVQSTFGFTVPALNDLPAESRLDGFANASERLSVSSVLLDSYHRAAEQVAAEAIVRGEQLLGCPLATLAAGPCLDRFLEGVGSKAWRRPLVASELSKLRKLFVDASAAAGPTEGLRMLVQGLVLSANFLFRVELGQPPGPDGVIKLTDHELASALSYMLWDGPPDVELMELAAAGKLRDRTTLLAQAKRLLASSAQAPEALASFVDQWLETEDFVRKPKDAATFPAYSPEVAADLAAETTMFLREVALGPGGGGVRALFNATDGYVNSRTAPLYGITGVTGTALQKRPLPAAQRRGLLTQGSFLAAHAEPINTSVVNRGRFIREEILCSDVPPPPGDFMFNEKNITEDMTAREKFVEHSKNPSCAACHLLFDTIGFALENYDAVGQYRTTEKGKTIDPSGKLPLPSGGEIQFANFVDMVDQLAAGTDAFSCFSAQYLQYASGRVTLDACERENVARAFEQSGYKLDALVVAVVGSDSFMARKD